MSASSTRLPTPEGPGSVSGAPNLPAGFTDTFTSRYIDTGQLRQHAVIGGKGTPLLLVHGWPETWYAWRLVMPALARDFSIVAVDQRGAGLSGKPTGALDTTIAQNQQRATRRLTLPALAIGGAQSLGEAVGNTMKLAADDVQSLVIPGCGQPPRRGGSRGDAGRADRVPGPIPGRDGHGARLRAGWCRGLAAVQGRDPGQRRGAQLPQRADRSAVGEPRRHARGGHAHAFHSLR